MDGFRLASSLRCQKQSHSVTPDLCAFLRDTASIKNASPKQTDDLIRALIRATPGAFFHYCFLLRDCRMEDAAALSLHLSSLSRKVSTLEESLARLTSEKDTAVEEVRQLNVAMQQAEDESHNQQTAWKNAAEEFRQEQKRLKKELELLVNENKELLVCLGAQKEQNSTLLESQHTQLKSLRSEKYSTCHELTDKTRDCASLQSQLASQALLVDTLEKEIERLRASIGDVKSTVVKQDKRLSEHKGKVHEGMVSQEALVKKINQQQETIESMRKQLGEAQDREAKSSERIDVLESDLFRANSRLSSLSAEWSESEKQLVNDAQEKKKLEDAIQHGESIIQALRGSLQEQNNKMEELKRMVQDVAMATPLLQTPTLQRGRSSTMNTPKCRVTSDRRGTGRLCSSDRTPTGQRCVTMMDDELTPSHFTTPHTTYPTDMKTPGAPIRTRGTSLIAEASEAKARMNSSAARKYSEMSWEFATMGGSSEDAVTELRCGAGSSGAKMPIGQQSHSSKAIRDVPMLEVLQGSGSQQSEDGHTLSPPEELHKVEGGQQPGEKSGSSIQLLKQLERQYQPGKDNDQRIFVDGVGGSSEELTACQGKMHGHGGVHRVDNQRDPVKHTMFSNVFQPTDMKGASFSQRTPAALKKTIQSFGQSGGGSMTSDCMEIERPGNGSQRTTVTGGEVIQNLTFDVTGEHGKGLQKLTSHNDTQRKPTGDCNKINYLSAEHISEQTREVSIEDGCTKSQRHPTSRSSNESSLCSIADANEHLTRSEFINADVHVNPVHQTGPQMDNDPECIALMSEKEGPAMPAITSTMDVSEASIADVCIDKENTSRDMGTTSGIPQPSSQSLLTASKKRARNEDQLNFGVSKIPKPTTRVSDVPESRNKSKMQHEGSSVENDIADVCARNRALSQQDSHQKSEGVQGLGGLFKSLAR